MPRLAFAGLQISWDPGDLPLDPFAPALPLELASWRTEAGEGSTPSSDLHLSARRIGTPASSPELEGAASVLFHGTTLCSLTDEGELVLWDGASLLRILDRGRRVEADVHASSLERAFHFSSVTVTMAVLLALRSHGLFHLHAACVRFADGSAWAMPGESDAGKSTLALALCSAGAGYVSDDAVLLRARGGGVELVGFPRMLRMTSQTARAFPELQPLLVPCPRGSARQLELDPRRAFADRLVGSVRAARVLAFPRTGSAAQSQVTELDRSQAFGRILHACAWVASEHLPHRTQQLDLLARLVDGARAYEVAIGKEILSDPDAVAADLRDRLG